MEWITWTISKTSNWWRIINKYLGYILLVISIIFSFSRIYVGVFYFLDVFSAAIMGFVIALLVRKIMRIKIINFILMKNIKILRLLALS